MAYVISDIVRDSRGVPVSDALVYVYSPQGGLASLYNDLGSPIENPLATNDNGLFEGYSTEDGYHKLSIHYGGRERTTDEVLLGTEPIARAEGAADALFLVNNGYWETSFNPPPVDAAEGQTYLATEDGRAALLRNDGGTGTVVFELDTLAGLTAALSDPTYGASIISFLQAGIGAIPRTVTAKLRESVSPDDYLAAGDGVALDTAKVNAAIAAIGYGGEVTLPPGRAYRVDTITNARNVGFKGGGVITAGTGNAAYALRSYTRRSGFIHGREYLYRLFQRIGSTGTDLTGFVDGDSTSARGNTTVVGGISGNVLTVSNAGTATLSPGTYITSVSPTCRINAQTGGTDFGNGTYSLNETAAVADGSTINIGNGGGFAGDKGEPQNLLERHFRRAGVRNGINFTNLAVGGSTWQDLATRNRAQYLTADTDILVVKAPVNRMGSSLTVSTDIAAMRQYFTALRSSTYGSVLLLSIVLVGYSPAHDTTNGRTSLYAELMHQACLQCVDDFKITFIDAHGYHTDGSFMVGNYLDAAGVHPGGFLQQQIWNKVGRAIIEAGDAQLSTGDDWVTLPGANGWVPYGNGFAPPQACLSPDGVVRLRGAIARASGTPTASQKMLDLPNSNYFPPFSIAFPATTFNGSVWSSTHLDVDVAGVISPRDTSAQNGFVSLENVTWRVW